MVAPEGNSSVTPPRAHLLWFPSQGMTRFLRKELLMSSRGWLRNPPSPARPRPAFRPGVEGLEARDVPTLMGNALFPANSPRNQKVNNAPVAANSATLVSSIGATARVHPDFGSGTYEGALLGIPYNVVPGNQPRVQ